MLVFFWVCWVVLLVCCCCGLSSSSSSSSWWLWTFCGWWIVICGDWEDIRYQESTVSYIKQYHIDNGYRFVVVESKSGKFICWCVDYIKGYPWRLQVAYSRVWIGKLERLIDHTRVCQPCNLQIMSILIPTKLVLLW